MELAASRIRSQSAAGRFLSAATIHVAATCDGIALRHSWQITKSQSSL